jgi:DNA-binding HxlR family transcriptional regulator
MNWRHLMVVLAPVRGRWDLAVLANLEQRETRPGDLIEAINAQAGNTDGHRISWKVLIDTLRRLEEEGYVGHREVSRLPRETRYWLLPSGRRLVAALNRLEDAWNETDEREETGAGEEPTDRFRLDP